MDNRLSLNPRGEQSNTVHRVRYERFTGTLAKAERSEIKYMQIFLSKIRTSLIIVEIVNKRKTRIVDQSLKVSCPRCKVEKA